MTKLIVSCDEKFPVFELEIPEEGQTSNCDIPEEIYRDFIKICVDYNKMQNILKKIYEDRTRDDEDIETMLTRCHECIR